MYNFECASIYSFYILLWKDITIHKQAPHKAPQQIYIGKGRHDLIIGLD